jgi:hypothetical protein
MNAVIRKQYARPSVADGKYIRQNTKMGKRKGCMVEEYRMHSGHNIGGLHSGQNTGYTVGRI